MVLLALTLIFFPILNNAAAAWPCEEGEIRVGITACPNFVYYGARNSLTIQIQGTLGETPWMVVDTDETLPNGNIDNQKYCVAGHNIGEILWTNLQLITSEHYCLYKVQLHDGEQDVWFGESNHFGSGVILTNNCEYNYRWVNDTVPLIPCYDSVFNVNRYRKRTIYNVEIHTCPRPESSVGVFTLQDDVTFSMLVRNNNETGWKNLPYFKLDHFMPSTETNDGFNGKRIGHLAATNYLLEASPQSHGNDFIAPISGTIIGMRINFKSGGVWGFTREETTGYAAIKNGVSEKWLQIVLREETTLNNEVAYYAWTNAVCLERGENGKCIDGVMFAAVDGYQIVNKGERLVVKYNIISGSGLNPTIPEPVDIFLIYLNYEKEYQMPYIRLPLTTNSEKGLFNADKKCMDTYGTHAASIHSEVANKLAKMYCKYGENCWIGLVGYSGEDGSDDGFWKWTDGTGILETNDVDYWYGGSPDDGSTSEDCVHFYGSESSSQAWNDDECDDLSLPTVICNSPYWFADQTRTFQLNFEEYFHEIVMLGISNSGDTAMCIDSVSAERQNSDFHDNIAAVKIGPTTWIGTDTGSNICSYVECSSSIYAMFTLPVCEINIVDTYVNLETFGEINYADASISGLTCRNENRFIASTCNVAQSLEITEETSVELSHTIGTSSDNGWTAGYEVQFNLGSGAGNYPIVEASQNFERYRSWTNSEESTTTDSFTASESKSVECSGSIDVPPYHEINYLLTLSQETLELQTLNTLELILCSAFLEGSDVQDDDNILYEYDVPGKVTTVTASICEVTFDTATRIWNSDLTCNKMQVLAIETNQLYIPQCNPNNNELYDGCQCTRGDTSLESYCYCVDSVYGSIIGGTQQYITTDWIDTCKSLNCENSIYVSESPTQVTSSPTVVTTSGAFTNSGNSSNGSKNSSNSGNYITTIVIMCIVFLFIILLIFFWIYHKKMNLEHKYKFKILEIDENNKNSIKSLNEKNIELTHVEQERLV